MFCWTNARYAGQDAATGLTAKAPGCNREYLLILLPLLLEPGYTLARLATERHSEAFFRGVAHAPLAVIFACIADRPLGLRRDGARPGVGCQQTQVTSLQGKNGSCTPRRPALAVW